MFGEFTLAKFFLHHARVLVDTFFGASHIDVIDVLGCQEVWLDFKFWIERCGVLTKR